MPETATLENTDHKTDVGPLTVATWPRLTATITDPETETAPVTVEMKFIGKPKTRTAPNAYLARAVILAAAASRAAEINRPIRVNVNPDSSEPLRLAVRPNGIVQEVDDENQIEDATDLLPAQFPCFTCLTQTGLLGECKKCGESHPFDREDTGRFLDYLIPKEDPLTDVFPDAELLPPPTTPKLEDRYRLRKRYLPFIVVAGAVYVAEIIGGGLAVIYVLWPR